MYVYTFINKINNKNIKQKKQQQALNQHAFKSVLHATSPHKYVTSHYKFRKKKSRLQNLKENFLKKTQHFQSLLLDARHTDFFEMRFSFLCNTVL